MKNEKRIGFNPLAPTQKQLLIVTGVWLVGVVLLVLVMTNLFTENPFQLRNTLFFFLIGASTISISFFSLNYVSVQKMRNKMGNTK